MWTTLSSNAGAPSLKSARIHFLRGDYEAALELALSAERRSDRFLFIAHVAYRMRDRARALAALDEGAEAGAFDRPSDRNLAVAMRSAALVGLGRHKDARLALQKVDLAAIDSARVANEARYYIAAASWMLKDYDGAFAVLEGAAEPLDANLEARYDFLRGWLHAAQGDYNAQIACDVRALELLEHEPFPDIGLQALVLRGLSALARDMARPDLLALITQLEASLPWTAECAGEHFQVIRTLAWANAMSGEYITAIRQLNRAKYVAPNAVAQMLSHLDHAWIAQISSEPLHMQVELSEAETVDGQIDWGEASDEAIGALVLYAELLASVEPAAARRVLERVVSGRRSLSQGMGFAHDKRLNAFFDVAESRVRAAAGERRVAIHRAKRAYSIFVDVGYRWRAAEVALSLFELTEDASWLERVEEVAVLYPRSFVAQRLEQFRNRGVSLFAQLTPRQREVVAGIRRGLRNNELAVALKAHRDTIRGHKRRIFSVFGVKSELELLKRLIEVESAA